MATLKPELCLRLVRSANEARNTALEADGDEVDVPDAILDLLVAHPFIGKVRTVLLDW